MVGHIAHRLRDEEANTYRASVAGGSLTDLRRQGRENPVFRAGGDSSIFSLSSGLGRQHLIGLTTSVRRAQKWRSWWWLRPQG
jgi:hypothetical protein